MKTEYSPWHSTNGVTAAASGTVLQPAKNRSFPYGLLPTWTHKGCNQRPVLLPSQKGAAFGEQEAGRGRGRWAEAREGLLHAMMLQLGVPSSAPASQPHKAWGLSDRERRTQFGPSFWGPFSLGGTLTPFTSVEGFPLPAASQLS